jgi:hypothetical protein
MVGLVLEAATAFLGEEHDGTLALEATTVFLGEECDQRLLV